MPSGANMRRRIERLEFDVDDSGDRVLVERDRHQQVDAVWAEVDGRLVMIQAGGDGERVLAEAEAGELERAGVEVADRE